MDRERAGLVVAVGLVAGLGLLGAVLRQPPSPPTITLTPARLPDQLPVTDAEGYLAPPQAVAVNVVGAVKQPGVYTFSQPVRVFQALAAAGGALPSALTEDMNLAAPLGDGDRLLVPTRPPGRQPGTFPVAAAPPDRTDAATGKSGEHGAALAGRINLNRASAAQLEQLPGIGPKLAQAILTHRKTHGSFRSAQDLLAVEGIGDKKLQTLMPYLAW